MQLNGKTVVLTGATGGIGRALALGLDKQGAHLVLVGRGEDKLRSLQKALGEGHSYVSADLSVDAGREELLRVCRGLENGVDVLINNAGVSQFAFLGQQTGIEAMINTNLTTPIILCQMLLPRMRQRPSACIVNIGSTFGSIGYPGFSTYCASKFGLRGFTQALRRELKGSTVDTIYIAPRATRTEINDDRVNRMNASLGNAMDDADSVAAQIIDALVKQNKAEVYIGWPEKLFVKVNSLFPAVVDQSLNKQLPIIDSYSKTI